MTKKIFFHSFLLGAVVLLLCTSLFFGLRYRETLDETYKTMKVEADYAAAGLALKGTEYLEDIKGANRITWIASDGNVLYDSDHPDLARNQGDCAEVRDALAEGEGRGIRKSESGKEKTIYYALRCDDNTVLRLSRPLSRFQAAFHSVSPVLWVLILVFLISGIISFRMANQILKPVNELDLDNLDDEDYYPELKPLIDKLQEQKLTIREQTGSQEQLRREFSANVSQELKTPLVSISDFAEEIREGRCDEERTKKLADDIGKESRRLIALIDDIIKLSRLDREGDPRELETIDLYEVSEEVLESLRTQAGARNINMTIEGEHEKIWGVWQLIQEMIYNLCDNAIKYNHDGGSVTIRIGRDNNKPWIEVSDDGIGIPKEAQDRVFERFYRVDKTHSKELGGTGLGLSIVKHGAQIHNAKVTMESNPGDGTSIRLIFPR